MAGETIQGQVHQRLTDGRANAGRPAGRSRPAKDDVFVANIAEKRYLWTARAFAVITALSLCCNVILVLAIFQVVPLYRVEPFLLTFQNRSEQVYNIQPITVELRNRKAITEVFVREYVLLRSTFTSDVAEVETRWMPGGPIQEMSTNQVYQDFLDNVAKKAVSIIKNQGMTRDVKILSVNELADGVWQVEYETKDMYPDSASPEVSYWTASLNVGYRRKTVKHGDRLKNPVGFTVVRYALSRNKVE
jgi:type IV secretory pathway component VirB8